MSSYCAMWNSLPMLRQANFFQDSVETFERPKLTSEAGEFTWLSTVLRYVGALLAVALAVLLRRLLDPLLGDDLKFLTLFAAVAIGVWLAGWRAGVMAMVLGFMAVNVWIVPSQHAFQVRSSAFWAGAGGFFLSSGLIIWMGESMRRAIRLAKVSDAKTRAVLESLSDGLHVIDSAGRITFFNAAARRKLAEHGEDAESLLGRPFFEVFPETLKLEAGLTLQKTLRERVPTEAVSFYPPWQRWFSVRSYPTEDGGVSTFFLDITERKLADERLRESEERFRSMADNIPPLAWIADEHGSLLWYNKRWYDYTGTTPEEMQGWGWQKLHQPDQLERIIRIWKEALATGKPWEDIFPLRGKDGKYGWFLSRAFPIRDSSGKITRWFGTNTDITELRETQEALRKAREELQHHAQVLESTVVERTAKLQAALGELEAYSYSIAHDIRAPLRSMHGFAKLLTDEYGSSLDARAQDYLRRITSSATRLDLLIQDVLSYSRVMSGELPLEPVDLKNLIGEILQSYPNLQDPKLLVVMEDKIPPVMANIAALTQVCSNLLGNAAKFVAPGVTPRIMVRAEQREKFVRLWFEDNGIGIEASAQKRIFELFQRLHRPDVFEGTGVGLAIVRKAVQRMGGNVGVESQVGKGSRFWVELQAVTSKAGS
ncbi:MAG TPA: PAS domain-containing protein [Candidatus Saccharimonadales bacterium]|nr:PAS domain-containing protein [Candidatus Saccharimonadales bacterium]